MTKNIISIIGALALTLNIAIAETQDIKIQEIESKTSEVDKNTENKEEIKQEVKQETQNVADKTVATSSKDTKTGFFVGLGIGVGPSYKCNGICEIDHNLYDKVSSDLIMINAKGGYQKYFNDNIGLRAYVSLDNGSDNKKVKVANGAGSEIDIKHSLTIVSANIDLMAQYKGFGVFGGVGTGSLKYKDNFAFYDSNANTTTVVTNVGIFLTGNDKFKLELSGKFFTLDDNPTNLNNKSSKNKAIYTLGFSYLF